MPRPLPWKIGDTKTIDIVNGGALEWNLDRIPEKIRGKFVHVLGFYFDTQAQISQQATTGVAVAGIDLPAMITSVALQRRQGVRRVNLSGYGLQTFGAVKTLGQLTHVNPGNIAANGTGAAVNTAKRFYPKLMFRDPHRYAAEDAVFPAAMYTEEGSISATFGLLSATMGATISYGAGTNQVTPYAMLALYDEPIFGVDKEYVMIDKASTATDDILVGKGCYEWLIYAPEKFAGSGGDDVTLATSFDSGQEQPLKISPAFSSSQYNGHYLADGNPFAWDSSSNLIGNNKCVVLQGISMGGKVTKEAWTVPSQFTCRVTLSGALARQHRFIAVRAFSPDLDEQAKCLARLGINGKMVTRVHATADGTAVKGGRQKLIPVKIVPGVFNPGMVR